MFDIPDIIGGIATLLLILFGGSQYLGKKKAESQNESLKVENSLRKQEAEHYKDIVKLSAKKNEIQQEVMQANEEDLRAPDKYSRN